MTITESLTNDRPTDADIGAFETLVHGSFPDDYKTFLKKENGGRPRPKQFRFTTKAGKTEESTTHYFFALHAGRVGSLQKSFERYEKRVASGYIPIGTDPFGNIIVMNTMPHGNGRIYFWNHETESDLPSVANMCLIAQSFLEFVEGLF
jgi:hypothetical protein